MEYPYDFQPVNLSNSKQSNKLAQYQAVQQFNLKPIKSSKELLPAASLEVDSSFGDVDMIGMGQAESFARRPWEASLPVAFAGTPLAENVRCPALILSQPQGLQAASAVVDQCNYLFPEVGVYPVTPTYNIRI